MPKPDFESCARSARRAGWHVRPLPGLPEALFARNGRTFLAAFPGGPLPAAEARQLHSLRAAGVSAYVVESAAEWAAALDFEDRHAEL